MLYYKPVIQLFILHLLMSFMLSFNYLFMRPICIKKFINCIHSFHYFVHVTFLPLAFRPKYICVLQRTFLSIRMRTFPKDDLIVLDKEYINEPQI